MTEKEGWTRISSLSAVNHWPSGSSSPAWTWYITALLRRGVSPEKTGMTTDLVPVNEGGALLFECGCPYIPLVPRKGLPVRFLLASLPLLSSTPCISFLLALWWDKSDARLSKAPNAQLPAAPTEPLLKGSGCTLAQEQLMLNGGNTLVQVLVVGETNRQWVFGLFAGWFGVYCFPSTDLGTEEKQLGKTK